MKKLMVLLFAAAMLLAPFADSSDARGGRGGGRVGRSIAGKGGGRAGRSSGKEQQRKRDLDRSEERDSLVGGKLRRRSR